MNWWFISAGIIQIIGAVYEGFTSGNVRWTLVYLLIGIVNVIVGTKP